MFHYQTDDKVFGFSLITSFLVHVFVLASLFYANMGHSTKKLLKNIEVVYYKKSSNGGWRDGRYKRLVE